MYRHFMKNAVFILPMLLILLWRADRVDLRYAVNVRGSLNVWK